MVMSCLSGHVITATIWNKCHMSVVIRVAMVPPYAYGYDDAYPVPSYAYHMIQASYGHGCPYVCDVMVMLCVSCPMVMDILLYTYHMIMVIRMVMVSCLC